MHEPTPTMDDTPDPAQRIEQLAGRYRLDGCCVEALERLLAIWNDHDDTGPAHDDDDVVEAPAELAADQARLVDDLHHGAVTSAFAEWVFDEQGRSPRFDGFVQRLLAVPLAEGPARYMRACNAVLGGAADEALDDVRLATEADGSFAPAWALLGDLQADAGQLSDALSSRRREMALGVAEPDIKMLESMLGPFSKAGRNDRCPCGSGRKYKQCCITEPKLSSAARRELALARAVLSMHGGIGHRDQLFAAAMAVHSAVGAELDDGFADRIRQYAFDPFIADVALFEGGGIERYLECRGAVVPTAEREWLQSLQATGRSLCEAEPNSDGTYQLRDVESGSVFSSVTLSHRPEDGEYLLGRVVADSLTGHPGVVGPSLMVTVDDRAALTTLMRGDPDDQAWLDWYATHLTPPGP